MPSKSKNLRLPNKGRAVRKRRLRTAPDAAVQAGEQGGAVTQIPKPAPTTPLESLRLDIPDYLALELRLRCAREKVTNAYLIMKALKNDGFHVEDVDLVKDRYKRKT